MELMMHTLQTCVISGAALSYVLFQQYLRHRTAARDDFMETAL
jgi:hypothetical protein